jgi:hypothetical protein
MRVDKMFSKSVASAARSAADATLFDYLYLLKVFSARSAHSAVSLI